MIAPVGKSRECSRVCIIYENNEEKRYRGHQDMCTYIAAFTTVNFDSTVSIETMAAVGGNSFNVFYQETCSVMIENELSIGASLYFRGNRGRSFSSTWKSLTRVNNYFF